MPKVDTRGAGAYCAAMRSAAPGTIGSRSKRRCCVQRLPANGVVLDAIAAAEPSRAWQV